MSAKNKEKASLAAAETTEEYSEGSLIYNMWIENLTITVNEGGNVILQTGKPKENPNPPPGGG
jgi:hypothetical protein